MGMDCHGWNGSGFSACWLTWRTLLYAAAENGWEPRGTRSCDLELLHSESCLDWSEGPPADGLGVGYMSNCFQLVDEEDAANLAVALKRAIDNGALEEYHRPTLERYASYGIKVVIDADAPARLEKKARKLIEMARAGDFYLL